ncbi:DUF4126 domain-containing protein [Dyadobacter frigoris]|uniref:DUF4126 domain-containing protein n=1 Tax=Dyadobacter frigoris TaxID=2576211 RepID=A0A4U6CUJ6_9BACT|nr:DUF4126 domain-containing protein [Dyadobacter frigoris]TKT87395.1 DUF4126 domain-containing protein [Dyadobacter frigoris]GLU55609.1 hypothetical protein Dfri01_50700 [Dyadobacter frigoris]
MEIFLSICLGLGLSASSGFRVFLPMLVANIATLSGWITPGEGFAWMATWTAFFVLFTATIAEISGYYIPFIDNLLDTIATPAAVIAGTLLSTSFIQIDNPVLHWGLGIIVGGGTAGLVQAGTGLLRLFSSKTTAGFGNPVVSTAENIASFSLSGLAIFLPIVALVLVVLLVVWLLKRISGLRNRK